MSNLIIFQKQELGKIRAFKKDGEPWFVAKDVCSILQTSTRDVPKILDEDEVDKIHITDSLGRKQLMTMINESGLYTLILRSNKPNAKKFRKWVTKEVLPAIRKTGKYEIKNARYVNPRTIAGYKGMIGLYRKKLKEETEKVKELEQDVKIYEC